MHEWLSHNQSYNWLVGALSSQQHLHASMHKIYVAIKLVIYVMYRFLFFFTIVSFQHAFLIFLGWIGKVPILAYWG